MNYKLLKFPYPAMTAVMHLTRMEAYESIYWHDYFIVPINDYIGYVRRCYVLT